MASKPNIILLVSDDHGKEALGCSGNCAIETPHMDALAEEGVYFLNSFCTTASCAASRSVILTGKHNHSTGTYGHTHNFHHFSCFEDVKTLPSFLNENGYTTGRVGKKHYAPEKIYPFTWDTDTSEFGRDDVGMSEHCREFVKEDGPFFLYWCSHNPHRSGDVLESHPCLPNRFGNPDASFGGDREREYSDDETNVPFFLPDTPEVRAELAQYYQSISRLDRGIGRLVEVLKEEGKYDDSVIIYISDNGAAFPEAKTTLYEPGMNLPCIVRTPLSRNKGFSCDGLITWADITPTILDFAGLYKDTDKFHGKSFRGILDKEFPADWRGEIYASHSFHEITNYYPMRVVRTKKYKFIWNIAWKLDYSFASDLWRSASWQGALKRGLSRFGARTVENYVHRRRFELYDLERDPCEVHNLAGEQACASLVREFAGKIRKFQEETGDPWVHKWEYE